VSVTPKKSTDDMLEVARQVVALARKKGAQEAAAASSRSREVDVTWRDGKLEKVSEAVTRSLSLQLYVDGRYSAASTSDLRPDAIERFVAESIVLTRALAADEHRRLPEPELYGGRSQDDLALEDARQKSVSADERRAFARSLEEAARAADSKSVILSVTASFGDSSSESHRVASNGFEGTHRTTTFYASCDVSVKDADGRRPEDYDYGVVRFIDDLPDAASLGRGATTRAYGRLGAAKAKSASLPMVVDNRVAGRLVSMLLGPLSGMAIQQKRSYLDGKLGKKIGSDKLHIVDDPLLRRGLASRHFDGEGIAARKQPIFQDGVLSMFFIDSYYGRKLGVKPTTGGASNLTWRLGSKNQAALRGDIKDGIFVTGFLGGNSNAATGDFSLGVQGFRIRKGQLAEPVSEMNIAGNQADLWKRLVAVGDDPFRFSSSRTPTLVFDKVEFAGV
jgi:PmbA protein